MQKITSKCKQRSMSPLMNEPQAARTINAHTKSSETQQREEELGNARELTVNTQSLRNKTCKSHQEGRHEDDEWTRDVSNHRTFKPNNLMGVTCPGTMQSGPAASSMASLANPSPTGFGCCTDEEKLQKKELRGG